MKTKPIYVTPEELEAYFEQYKQWVEENPILVQDYVGKDGTEVNRKKNRPLTFDGFEIWLRKNSKIKCCQHILDNVKSAYNDFIDVARYIKASVKADQIEGGMAGIYNPNITARLNGLTEKIQEDGSKEVTIKVKYERKGNNPE
jgi:hypothetical protein